MKQILFILVAIFFFHNGTLKAQSYPGVWFENSTLALNYSNSSVHYEGKSWVRNMAGNLPVSDSVFFTPNNALELNYISAGGGRWTVDMYYPNTLAFQPARETTLSLKIFVQSETTVDQLPGLKLIQGDSLISPLIPLKKYIQGFQQNMWFSVDVPLKEVSGLDFQQGIRAIRLVQHSSDGKEHHIYIDQVEILPSKLPQNILTGAAVLSSVKAFEKHVDITWQLPLTPNIRYIKVYRSVDNQDFEAVAIRPIYARRYSDIIPKTDQVYYYKVAWVDYQYRESPFSEVKEAKPQLLTDENLVEMVQGANIRYYIDGEEFNSGMQLEDRAAQNAVVSVKNSGVGILALMVGAEKGVIPKEQVLKRIEKIVSFLKRAESISGAFPELFDGRTGKAIDGNRSEIVSVSLGSTAAMIEGLLVARQYFSGENDAEEALRRKITEIWKAVEWNAFVKPQTHYLYSNWSREEGFTHAIPLSGESTLSIYMMAIASPNYNIALDAYSNAATRPLERVQKHLLLDRVQKELPLERVQKHLPLERVQKGSPSEGVQNDLLSEGVQKDSLLEAVQKDSVAVNDSIPNESVEVQLPEVAVQKDSLKLPYSLNEYDYQEVPYRNDSTYYGIQLAVGSDRSDLLADILGFIAFDPRNKRDDFANYFENTTDLVRVQHRAGLEHPNTALPRGGELESSDRTISDAAVFIPAKGVAIYPFCPDLAIKNIRDYYRKYAKLLWTEYGFVRAVDLNKNHIVYPEKGVENALTAVMIENARSGMIWNLYMKDPDLAKVIGSLFKLEEAEK